MHSIKISCFCPMQPYRFENNVTWGKVNRVGYTGRCPELLAFALSELKKDAIRV